MSAAMAFKTISLGSTSINRQAEWSFAARCTSVKHETFFRHIIPRVACAIGRHPNMFVYLKFQVYRLKLA